MMCILKHTKTDLRKFLWKLWHLDLDFLPSLCIARVARVALCVTSARSNEAKGFWFIASIAKRRPAPCKVVTSSGSQTKRCDVVTLSSKWDIETFLRKSCNMRRKAQSCSLNMSVFYRLATKYWHSGINLLRAASVNSKVDRLVRQNSGI